MSGLSGLELLGLKCIAEDMAAIVFDEAVLDRLEALGLAVRRGGTWRVTPEGRAVIAVDEADEQAAAVRPAPPSADQAGACRA